MTIRQLLRKIKRKARVEIVWKDIRSHHQGWTYLSDIDEKEDGLATIQTLGYFLSYMNGVLTIAESWDQDDEFVGQRLCLPVEVLQEIRVL